MTWHDFTWFDNPVWQCTCDKTVMSQHAGPIFSLGVCCVKMGMTIMSSKSIEESLVASVWMHKDSTCQMMNQVITHFQQWFGKPCLCRATVSVWGKVCVCRGIWRNLLGAVDQYPTWSPALWLPLSLNDHHTSLCGNNQQNLEYYIEPCLTTRGTWWWSYFGQRL